MCDHKDKKELTQEETDKLFDSGGQFFELPPTPGFNKLGPAAQHAARSRAKNFYPFD
jgi:hypothetical protein